MIGSYLGGSAAEGWEMNPTKWAWDGDTWAGIGLGAVAGGAAGLGFFYSAPALAGTGFFANFGASGTIAAYTIAGGATMGAGGYAAGFGGGMLHSNGDWGYSHQSGVLGFKVGATIGSFLGAGVGTWEAYKPRPEPKPSYKLPELETEPIPEPNRSNNISLTGTPSFELGSLQSRYREPRTYYERALQYQGVPYLSPGKSYTGIDCSGLVCASTLSDYRWYTSGGAPPGNWYTLSYTHTNEGFTKTARRGDLLLWPGRHTAYYAGNGRLFHAHGSKGTPTGFTSDFFRWWIPNRGWPTLYRQH